MLRLSSLALTLFPWVALAQGMPGTPVRDTAPLAPLWIAVGFVLAVALLAILLGGPRLRARAHAHAGPRRGATPPRA
jgi:hypothetical protein